MQKRTLKPKQSEQVQSLDEESLSADIKDLTKLEVLNEPSILHVLRERFNRDDIYTSVSSILISVNPFKSIPKLYTEAELEKYRDGGPLLPPHIFGLASTAFNSLRANQRSQSLIIGGESGAGKTEATKFILRLLANVSR